MTLETLCLVSQNKFSYLELLHSLRPIITGGVSTHSVTSQLIIVTLYQQVEFIDTRRFQHIKVIYQGSSVLKDHVLSLIKDDAP